MTFANQNNLQYLTSPHYHKQFNQECRFNIYPKQAKMPLFCFPNHQQLILLNQGVATRTVPVVQHLLKENILIDASLSHNKHNHKPNVPHSIQQHRRDNNTSHNIPIHFNNLRENSTKKEHLREFINRASEYVQSMDQRGQPEEDCYQLGTVYPILKSGDRIVVIGRYVSGDMFQAYHIRLKKISLRGTLFSFVWSAFFSLATSLLVHYTIRKVRSAKKLTPSLHTFKHYLDTHPIQKVLYNLTISGWGPLRPWIKLNYKEYLYTFKIKEIVKAGVSSLFGVASLGAAVYNFKNALLKLRMCFTQRWFLNKKPPPSSDSTSSPPRTSNHI